MAYDFYNAYLTIAPANQLQRYKEDLQALIDNQFANASDTYTIQEELTKGTLTLSDVAVRVGHAIDNLTGEKLGDDWRNVIFQDLDHLYGIGHRYYFNGYYWITINTDFYKYVTASCLVRRCNYTLKWYNDAKTLLQEPCIVDYYKFTARNSGNISESQYQKIGEAYKYIFLQDNTESHKIYRDRRFIIDRRAYKVVNSDSITKLGLYILTVEEHQINTATDDVTNGIADAYGQSIIPDNNQTLW
jgi:hypothetical protein